MSAEDQSLLERVEIPSIPKETATKISHLQEQFIRAEVEQRKLPVSFISSDDTLAAHPIGVGTFSLRARVRAIFSCDTPVIMMMRLLYLYLQRSMLIRQQCASRFLF